MPTLRRPYSRDWLTNSIDPDEFADSVRFLAWKQRLRDHSIVAADDVRLQYQELPALSPRESDFIGGTIQAPWVLGGTGLPVVNSGKYGEILIQANGASGTSWIDFGNFQSFDKTNMPRMQAKAVLDTDLQQTARLGFYNASLTQDFIWFEQDPGASTANWFAKSNLAGTGTSVDTGVAANTAYSVFEIKVDSVKGGINFSIDGYIKATITTNIPTLLLQPLAYMAPKGAAVKTLRCEYFRVWTKRT